MPATINSIAAACGVSNATVSRALSDSPAVRPELRERIKRHATRLGYQRNELVGAVMAYVRTARANTFIGNLAVVHIPTPTEPRLGNQLKRIAESARDRARSLGFEADFFTLRSDPKEEQSLIRMLRARGVSGVLFLYPGPSDLPRAFPWQEFASVSLDLARRDFQLHTVCHDHFSTLKVALMHLAACGYRRVGLFIERFKDERTDFRWSAAVLSFHEPKALLEFVPVCSPETITEPNFIKWYSRYRPDLIIGHVDEAVAWLARAGLRVPRDVGFFNLNWEGRTIPCAGIDPQLEL